MPYHIVDEARRCLGCKNPQCIKGCPVGTPIDTFIRLLMDGKMREAGRLLYMNNPLSLICSFICNHESQCEGHCIQSKHGKTVQISAIENYISSYFINFIQEDFPRPTRQAIAIIGSGPAGLTLSILLARRGF